MIELIIVVTVVILTSATCSLFEAVLYSVPMSHIESMVSDNRRSGRIMRRLRENVDSPIAAILSLNTIANTAGAAVAGAIASDVLGTRWLAYFSASFTLTILIFSEVIPKTAGVVHCRPLASIIAIPLEGLVKLFSPVIWLCGIITRLIAGAPGRHQVSEEEILMLARIGARTGGIHPEEEKVIQNILSLESKTARQIMTPRIVLFTLAANGTVDESRTDKGLYKHSRIPVYLENFENIIGIVHRHDILAAVADDKLTTKLETLMSPVHFILDSTTLDKVLKKFLELRQQIFVVIGEFGGLSGVITLEDILEEVLGAEIVDEFDEVEDMRLLAQQRRQKLLDEIPEPK